MIAYLKRRGIYEVSIGIGKESYENENDWLNDGDRSFEQYVCPFLLACATVLVLLNTQRIYGKNWT